MLDSVAESLDRPRIHLLPLLFYQKKRNPASIIHMLRRRDAGSYVCPRAKAKGLRRPKV
ncbi:hypothetical protein C4546_00405 [Candidatus Parcubacteria bacterium]|nr:MAG: hypothetical protein C4546_00405 [Candidatus Parcubacteria bacterium]